MPISFIGNTFTIDWNGIPVNFKTSYNTSTGDITYSKWHESSVTRDGNGGYLLDTVNPGYWEKSYSIINGSKNWESFNQNIVSGINGVAGIFEQGGKYASKSINTASELASNLRLLKITGSVSFVSNISQAGYAFFKWNQNKTNANFARLVTQGVFIGLEAGANFLLPGAGIFVGIGLNILEAEYGEDFYNKFN